MTTAREAAKNTQICRRGTGNSTQAWLVCTLGCGWSTGGTMSLKRARSLLPYGHTCYPSIGGDSVGSVASVPNKPATPHRTIRCDPALWDAAKAKAEREDPSATISDVIRRLLEQYINDDKEQQR